jgi:putative endonuclease
MVQIQRLKGQLTPFCLFLVDNFNYEYNMFHMKRFTSKTQKIGEYGEKICAKWLTENDYMLLERNFTTNKGEIDIVCRKESTLHFVEVKSSLVSHETNTINYPYNPAENVTKEKLYKCILTIREYLKIHNFSNNTIYQFDVYIIYIDKNNKKHKIERILNVF